MANASPGSDEPLSPATATPVLSSWSTTKLIGFRFAFVYLLLYCLPRCLQLVPFGDWLAERVGSLVQVPVVWFADSALGITITSFPAGSGDTTYNYVHVLLLAIVATIATAIWTVIAGHRHPPLLPDRLRIYLRFFLGATLVGYGSIKVLKSQFPPLQLEYITEPIASLSPMGLLWTFMGHSTAYCAFTGAVEIIGGLLLFWRRTTTLGALIVASAMTNVLALNLSYDVCVKLLSFHLIIIALVVLGPDAGRLADVLIRQRPTTPAVGQSPFRWRCLERARTPIKTLVIIVVLGMKAYGAHTMWATWGNGREPVAARGYYEVHTFLRGGVVQRRDLDDVGQWRSFAISPYGNAFIRTMRGRPRWYQMSRLPLANIMLLVQTRGGASYGWLLSRREGSHGFVVRGLHDGVPIEARMRRVDETDTELMGRGFHWINEVPHNR
jgi:hypothetical protein